MFDTESKKKFFDYFVGPILKFKPKQEDPRDWLNLVFCVNSRIIRKFKVKEEFCVPGNRRMIVDGDPWPREQRGYAVVKKKRILFMRHDRTEKNKFDIEVQIGDNKNYSWFKLTEAEWTLLVLPKLKEIPFKKGYRSYASWE